MTTALIYDRVFIKHDTGHHPENSERFKRILSALEEDESLWAALNKLAPEAATDEDIIRCHSPQLIEQLSSLCERGIPFVDLDTVISAESFDVARLAAGAVVVRSRSGLQRFVSKRFRAGQAAGPSRNSESSHGLLPVQQCRDWRSLRAGPVRSRARVDN